MKVLVVGSGAREHALAWRLHGDGAEVHAAPGNAGTARVGTNHSVEATDLDGLVMLAGERGLAVDLVIVGPEAPLVEGLVDRLAANGIASFGPSRAAARLEGSKVFAKELMEEAGVPTAGFQVFDDADAALDYCRAAQRPLVVKADGLAAGKGVVVAEDAHHACAAVERMMRQRAFGDAGDRVLIEEVLQGPEISYHVLCSGEAYVPLAAAQDHKRIGEGERGPNTGGMGAYSPPPLVTAELESTIRARVVEPTLRAMAARGTPFRGVLFIGLMVVDGSPRVLEYNVRFGDPECECLMVRFNGNLGETLHRAAHGELATVTPRWGAPASLAVVLASEGYPGPYPKGRLIEGIDSANAVAGVTVFHAGTADSPRGLVTAGGRVLTVTAIGDCIDQAAERAYRAAERIHFEGRQMRRDIGWRARGDS